MLDLKMTNPEPLSRLGVVFQEVRLINNFQCHWEIVDISFYLSICIMVE